MKTKIILALLAFTILSGCVPAAFVAGAAVSGVVVADNRSLKTMTLDKETTLKAQVKINTDPELKSAHIGVATFNHIALLVGQAQTPEQSQTAYDIVNQQPNIKRIYNKITIGPVTSQEQRAKDMWITTKVRTRMLAEKGLHSAQTKVVTEDNTVYLLGLLTHSQGSLAALVASNVDGVEKVVTLFEYLN